MFARHHTTWVTAPIQLGDSRVVRTEILIRDLDSDTTSLLATSELPTNVHTAWLEWRGERVRYRASGAADSVVEEWAVPHRNTGSPLPEGSAWRDGRHGVPSGVCIAGVEDIAG